MKKEIELLTESRRNIDHAAGNTVKCNTVLMCNIFKSKCFSQDLFLYRFFFDSIISFLSFKVKLIKTFNSTALFLLIFVLDSTRALCTNYLLFLLEDLIDQ